MKSRLTIVIAFISVLVFTGCRSTRQAASTSVVADSGTPTEVRREYSVLNFSATVAGISANGQVRMAQDSAIWVSVSKLIELGRAMATVDSVWVSAPMMDVRFAGNYDDLSRKIGRKVSFEELQQMALSPDAEQRIARLANDMGYEATVSIKQRRRVDHLIFPFPKL